VEGVAGVVGVVGLVGVIDVVGVVGVVGVIDEEGRFVEEDDNFSFKFSEGCSERTVIELFRTS